MTDESEQSSSSVIPCASFQNGCSAKECCSKEGCTFSDDCESQAANSCEGCMCAFDRMPDVVMQCVFETFDLRERSIASQVCRRWHYLLTCRFPMEDVTVLNIFQHNIYKEKISSNKNIGLKCYHIDNADMLLTILQHCHSVSSVKIWFWSSSFAGEVLKMLKQMNIKMRCLDLYPYRAEEALDEAFAAFPDLTGMTMRPHGQDYFWSGLDLTSFPRFGKMDTLMLDGFNIRMMLFQEEALDEAFAAFPDLTGMTMRPHGQDYFWSGLDLTSFPRFGKMDTLMLDGFNIHPDVFLPESLTTLEWLNRSGHFLVVMPKLKSLVNLEYLMLGHAEFSNSEEFDAFLTTISSENLPRLQYLGQCEIF
ncbi:hypothetical protein Tcan_05170 [Toxocara canis]|uniref:F-box domain-containing protein n=2 Tax=Toxocara canis TaxID=6265 RepID=A0A0B2V3V9_TOXCA|nr:hypothetical protein Tcan_05170 [Toxocara canis]